MSLAGGSDGGEVATDGSAIEGIDVGADTGSAPLETLCVRHEREGSPPRPNISLRARRESLGPKSYVTQRRGGATL